MAKDKNESGQEPAKNNERQNHIEDYPIKRRKVLKSAGSISTVGSIPASVSSIFSRSGIAASKEEGIIIDDDDAAFTGNWKESAYREGYYGNGYHYTRNGNGGDTVRWEPEFSETDEYLIFVSIPAGNAQSANRAPYLVNHDNGIDSIRINQNVENSQWYLLGSQSFSLSKGNNNYVELSNNNVSGKYVFADAVKFLPIKYGEPESPTGIEAEASNGVVYLDWNAVEGPTDYSELITYNLKRSKENSESYTTIKSDIVNPFGGEKIYWIDNTVENGIEYHYTVSAAIAGGGESINSEDAIAVPSLQPPIASPKELTTVSGDKKVELSWRPILNATSYKIQRKTETESGFSTVSTSKTTTFTDESVDNGVEYQYIVRGENEAGISNARSDQTAAVPSQNSELIVDSTQAMYTGEWPSSTYSSNYYATNYRYASPSSEKKSAKFMPEPDEWSAGEYSVWVHSPRGKSNYASDASYTVYHSNGTDTYQVDQQRGGSTWRQLGSESFQMIPGAAEGRKFTGGPPPHGVGLNNTDADGGVIADAVRFIPKKDTPDSEFGIDWERPQQQLEGIGVEIQFDCIGPNNVLDDCTDERVPAALSESERTRWYNEMLDGFRYIRLAMGLYLRGTTDNERLIRGRYPGQIEDIAETVQKSGATVNAAYWSPARYFKIDDDLTSKTLKSKSSAALADLANAMKDDIEYLQDNDIDVSMWSLQNEPNIHRSLTYSHCSYYPSEYANAYGTVGRRVRSEFPSLRTHGPNNTGATASTSALAEAVDNNPIAHDLIDRWSYHGAQYRESPDEVINDDRLWADSEGRPLMNVEYSQFGGAPEKESLRFGNTVKNILNHFVYTNSPTWFWLHALKPTVADEETGDAYSLGTFRPASTKNQNKDYELEVGEWQFYDPNWNALSGFVKRMPHDAVRYSVLGEDATDSDRVTMAWKGPDDSRGIALYNDHESSEKKFKVDLGEKIMLTGEQFSKDERFVDIGMSNTQTLNRSIKPKTLEIWN